jgi:hypothetical protein
MTAINKTKSNTYETNLDLFIQYYQNPTIRSRSKPQLERIGRELIDIRVRANESKRVAVKNIHLHLLRSIEIDIFDFASYLDEETNAIARNLQSDLDRTTVPMLFNLNRFRPEKKVRLVNSSCTRRDRNSSWLLNKQSRIQGLSTT